MVPLKMAMLAANEMAVLLAVKLPFAVPEVPLKSNVIALRPPSLMRLGTGKVLMLTRGVVPARPLLLEASLYRSAATVMLETAEAVLTAGVKVACCKQLRARRFNGKTFALQAILFPHGDDFEGGNQGLLCLKLLDAFNDHAGFTVLCDEKGLAGRRHVFANLGSVAFQV